MKIDRSFVADVCADRRAASIVRAVIDLAHAHDLTVVAEGVETAEQLEALRHMECDMVQGFHLGRPQPAADLMRLAA
jgi:EAL domain-containing protein (putative c-di-GMP-specific phosphodiesterase class I)